jgi:hypothetical protein
MRTIPLTQMALLILLAISVLVLIFGSVRFYQNRKATARSLLTQPVTPPGEIETTTQLDERPTVQDDTTTSHDE